MGGYGKYSQNATACFNLRAEDEKNQTVNCFGIEL
jgi:hypothetical protein